MQLTRDIKSFAETEFDLLVIGGGINGAAITNLAAHQGLKVALIEKGDFASGTSSKSTKLIHGGIRYLENFEFDLVHEALLERAIQLKKAPHLVHPIRFIIPVYKGDKRPLWMMKLGVFLYDKLAGKYNIQKHSTLSKTEIHSLEPNLTQENLKGGVSYWDAQMDDARLCLENVLSGVKSGAKVLNYTEVTAFLKNPSGEVKGVRIRDLFHYQYYELRANRVICCAGPWTNYFVRLDNPHSKKIVRTTKGVHIVYKGKLTNNAVLLSSQKDKRIFFVIPWLENTLIGTTDTDFIKHPDKVEVEQSDIDYLMNETKRAFPNLELKSENIITSFAGLRPLIRTGGVLPSKASRKHLIFETESELTFVIGGKYTTYRKVAEDCLKKIYDINAIGDLELYAGEKITEKLEDIAKRYGISIESAKAILDKYGSRYKDVLDLIWTDASLKETFCTCTPFIKAQVAYAVQAELAQTADDIISRRLSLQYHTCTAKNCSKYINNFMANLS